MPKQTCLYYLILFLGLTSQKRYVSSGGAPGDTVGTVAVNRYATQTITEQQQQQQQHHHMHHHGHTPPGGHHPVGSGSPVSPGAVPSTHAIYHTPSGSGHIDNRNSYNLLSEAMSQAVSNEFSSLGSGSADGACHADDIDCLSGNIQDRLGMEAIRTLHRQLDDDDNGNIDLSESDDFLREELKYDSGYEKRQKAFHFNDDMHISVKELWEAWLRSEVHNWTIEQTTDWLAQSVQLPQYVDLFKLHKVTGAALPRLAVNNMHYVSNVLGIKDPIHKQKIALKAMDVVLFGPPRETGTRWKDYILVTLLLSAIIGCWYAYQQNKNAKRHLRRMAQDMEGLQRAEQSLQEMQKELERARMEQENVATEKMDLERRLKEAPSLSSSSSDLEVQQLKKEIEMLRSELSRAEIELVDNCWSPPPQLQSWLQYTYELESKNHLKKRIAAEKQLQSAREACEKLRKKRSSLVGAFVSTHGKSIDDVDRSIVEARNSLGEVTNELQERLHRWKQIETCLGLNIVNNNGLSYLESVLYGRNGGSTKSSRGRMTSSTDDLDDDSVQGMLDSYSRSTISGGLGGSGIISSSSNTIRDDSSCSDDGTDNQSVQFYLGGSPTTPIMNTVPMSVASTTTTATGASTTQRTHYPLDAINHIGNNLNSMSLPSTPATTVPATPISGGAASPSLQTPPPPLPPPLPPHNNAHTNFSLNDSQMLRSQSTDLVPMEIYTFLSKQQQQQQQQQQSQYYSSKSVNITGGQQHLSTATTSTTTAGGMGGASSSGASKKMVKQHSTASQQSTSSTSSSIQSAPSTIEGAGGNGHSPSRWSSHDGVIATHDNQFLLYQHQHNIQQQHGGDKNKKSIMQSHCSGTAAPTSTSIIPSGLQHISAAYSLQSVCGGGGGGVASYISSGSGSNIKSTTTATPPSSAIAASPHGDTEMDDPLLLPTDSASLDGSIKKRKRRLRFPFGGSRKSVSGSGSSKGKLT